MSISTIEELQAALDNPLNDPIRFDSRLLPIFKAARLVANAVPVVMTSRFVQEYAVTADPTEADAWLITPGDTK